MPALTSQDGLRIALKTAGGLRKLARLIGVAHTSLRRWDKIPAERVIDTERATGIPRGVLRPDLFPPVPEKPSRKKKGALELSGAPLV